MNPNDAFAASVAENIAELRKDQSLRNDSLAWVGRITPAKYAYNFRWMGRPIIQLPQDMLAMQEIIWELRPDIILETGIAHGGSLVYYASLCHMIGHGRVIGIDIDIRPHNREAIEAHPMISRIDLIEGSSIDPEVVADVRRRVEGKSVLVVLDSNHTHEHVLSELEAYTPLVPSGGYCVVFDTIIESISNELYPDRPWSVGNNPKTAVREFLLAHPEFEVDEDIESKILITVAPGGYLRRKSAPTRTVRPDTDALL